MTDTDKLRPSDSDGSRVEAVGGIAKSGIAVRPLRRRYSSMGGPTMPDPNGSTTVDSSSRDKPTSLG